MTNLSLFLTESADMYPGAVALRCEGVTTTYSELADQAARFAAYVCTHDVQPGDRVGIMLGNRPEFAAAFYGILHAGAVAVLLDPLRSARETQMALMNTNARLLFFAASCAPVAAKAALAAGASPIELDYDTLDVLTDDFAGRPRPVSRAADDDAVIVHEFGTTGAPRGAELTHANLVTTQAVIARSVLDLGPEDVVLGCLPLFHAFGLTCGLMAAICTGSTLVLLPGFDARRALEMVAAQRVTVIEAAPSMYTEMLATGERCGLDLGSLRVCISCGPALPGDTRRRYEERFGCVLGGLRTVGFGAGGLLQPPRQAAQDGIGRQPGQRRSDTGGRRTPQGSARGHHRRASGARPQRDEGLLESARGNRGRNSRGLAVQRRDRLR
jgi:long-chain acyl-CoA synthetase